MRFKSFYVISVIAVIAYTVIAFGCSTSAIDKQTADQNKKPDILSGITAPLKSDINFGSCIFINRWQPNQWLVANADSSVTVHPRTGTFDDWQWEVHYVCLKDSYGQNKVPGVYLFKNLKFSNSTYSYYLTAFGYTTSTGVKAFSYLKLHGVPVSWEGNLLNGYIYDNAFYLMLWKLNSYPSVWDGTNNYYYISNWYIDSLKMINIENSYTDIYTDGVNGWWSGQWLIHWYTDD